jgi:DTW domain-containing protein YfiP
MLAQNPLLQSLPRYALKDVPNSRYQIRRAHAPDQLSSLEACAYALMQLESANEELRRLLTAFDRLNQMQLEFGVHNLVRTKK